VQSESGGKKTSEGSTNLRDATLRRLRGREREGIEREKTQYKRGGKNQGGLLDRRGKRSCSASRRENIKTPTKSDKRYISRRGKSD